MSSKPMQRSTQLCREEKWTYGITEKWNAAVGVRQDFLGVIDLIVMDGAGGGPLGVQCGRDTGGGDHAAHRAKALAEPRLRAWLESPARFEIWSWGKKGARGKRKLWTVRREAITLADLPEPSSEPSQHATSE